MALRLIDFGLVVLIWITQLVIYPSFTFYSEKNLRAWHSKYTSAIPMVVIPLMLSQIALHGVGLLYDFGWIRMLAFLLVLCAWVNTFLIAVPLHGKITEGEDVIFQAHRLVEINKYRVVFWTLVAILGLIRSSEIESLYY